MKRFRRGFCGVIILLIGLSFAMGSCGKLEKMAASNGESTGVEVNGEVEKVLDPVPPSDKVIADGYVEEDIEPIRSGEDLELIRAKYQEESANQEEGTSFYQYPEYIARIEIPELSEKTHMKAYHAYSVTGNPAGVYLIYDARHSMKALEGASGLEIAPSVLPVFDSLEETCIADIDQNGEYELLSLHGFGSGIYRINLNVYQYSNPIYFNSLNKVLHLQYQNCFIPKNGFGKLIFEKVSEHEVHLREVNVETNEVVKDYGKIVIDMVKLHAVPEFMEEFPYEQWDLKYNQENWKKEEFDYETLDEIPNLKVSVGKAMIPVLSAKKGWDGEQEDIAFADLMKEEIPRFAPPDNLYGSDQEICLDFGCVCPTSIQVTDTLITKEGQPLYTTKEILDRYVRNEGGGTYYFDLGVHFALLLSSNSASYTNPSYRGFRVLCEFGEGRSCEYVFVLSLDPVWKVDE